MKNDRRPLCFALDSWGEMGRWSDGATESRVAQIGNLCYEGERLLSADGNGAEFREVQVRGCDQAALGNGCL